MSTPDAIIAAAAEAFGVTSDRLKGVRAEDRDNNAMNARHFACYIMHTRTGLTLTSIGEIIGTNHGTVKNSVRRADQLRATSADIDATYARILSAVEAATGTPMPYTPSKVTRDTAEASGIRRDNFATSMRDLDDLRRQQLFAEDEHALTIAIDRTEKQLPASHRTLTRAYLNSDEASMGIKRLCDGGYLQPRSGWFSGALSGEYAVTDAGYARAGRDKPFWMAA